MPNPVLNMEAANLFCGRDVSSSSDDASNHLILSSLKLPTFDVHYEDHHPGGAPMAIEIDFIISKLDCTFVLLGMTPQVMGLVRSVQDRQTWHTAFMVLRDQVDGHLYQAVARMHGVLSRVDQMPWSKGDALHSSYRIGGMTHYEFRIAGQEVYYWDFGENVFRSNEANLAVRYS